MTHSFHNPELTVFRGEFNIENVQLFIMTLNLMESLGSPTQTDTTEISSSYQFNRHVSK